MVIVRSASVTNGYSLQLITLFPFTVKIRMQIDCETISDPQPRLETSETAVIAIQGTQACGDELVVTGTSEETPEGTQDTQAGRHEMVVTGVKRKAVEPVTSTGLPLAGRRESVEEAGVGSDIVPNAQGVMKFHRAQVLSDN